MPSKNKTNTPIIIVFSSIMAGIIGFLAATIMFLFQSPTNPDKPLDATRLNCSDPLTIGCEGQ